MQLFDALLRSGCLHETRLAAYQLRRDDQGEGQGVHGYSRAGASATRRPGSSAQSCRCSCLTARIEHSMEGFSLRRAGRATKLDTHLHHFVRIPHAVPGYHVVNHDLDAALPLALHERQDLFLKGVE